MADLQETPSKTDALGRKVWDKEYYTKRALVRQYEDGDFDDEDILNGGKRKKLKKEPPPPSERQPLQQRKETVALDSELGKSKIVTTHTPKQQQGGFWCDVCECLIKDSQAYLDHINGKRHNRILGMTMRVERVGVSNVRERLNLIKQEKEKQQQQKASDYGGVEMRLAKAEEAKRQRKKEKKEKKKKKKKKKEELSEEEPMDDDSPAAIAERIRQMFSSTSQESQKP